MDNGKGNCKVWSKCSAIGTKGYGNPRLPPWNLRSVIQTSSQLLVLFILFFFFPSPDKNEIYSHHVSLAVSVQIAILTALTVGLTWGINTARQQLPDEVNTNWCSSVPCAFARDCSIAFMISTSLASRPGCLLGLAPLSLLTDEMDLPNTHMHTRF